VWETTVDGRVLHFHLAGINNQNFIMRDEETGSWWQQVSGEAILGPLQGHKLKSVFHDEISFALWKREQPEGRVLRPDERILAAKEYAREDWETRMVKAPVVKGADQDQRLAPRELVIGLTIDNRAIAYPFARLQKQSPIIDLVGDTPVVIVLGEDQRSVRAFERKLEGRTLEFFKRVGASVGEGKQTEKDKTAAASGIELVDAETGSSWNFEGKATSGALAGRQLKKVAVLEDYWFDWRIYHPDTRVYQIGEQ
jgi:hypothetical protein